MTKTALICGISGQDGSYLAKLLIEKGYNVWGTSRDIETRSFVGLSRLGILDNVQLRSMSPSDFSNVWQVFSEIQPDEVYNLAGQSSVALSFSQPIQTMDSISNTTLNQLEAIRQLGLNAKFYNAGSGEIFGNITGIAADENTQFSPQSPYAVAKASSSWLVSVYRSSYGIHACTGILFNHESPFRHERFVTKKIVEFARMAAGGRQNITLKLGDLSVCRDWGWAPEYVEAMWLMLNQQEPQDLVISTGISQTLKEFTITVFEAAGLDWERYVVSDPLLFRPSDPAATVGNSSKARRVLNWQPVVVGKDVARKMYMNDFY